MAKRCKADYVPFWTQEPVTDLLLAPLEQYATLPARDKPVARISREVQRLGPTQFRMTFDSAEKTNANSIPDWAIMPEPTPDELADAEDFWLESLTAGFGEDSDTGVPLSREPEIGGTRGTAVLRAIGPGFEYEEDLTPEREILRQRTALIEAFAKALQKFHAEMIKRHGRDYLQRVGLEFIDPVKNAAFSVLREMDLANQETIVKALLAIDECGFPRDGDSLQRLYPPLRVADCGVYAIAWVTCGIEAALAATRMPRRSNKKVAGQLTIRCIEKLGCALILKTEGKQCSLKGNRMNLILDLLNRIRDRDERPFATYQDMLHEWPSENPEASYEQNLETLASRIAALNGHIRSRLELECNVVKNFDSKGYWLCEDNVRWVYAPDERGGGSARSDFNAGMAIRGKHAGVAPSEDPEEVRELDAATPRMRNKFIAGMKAMTALLLKSKGAIEPNALADIRAMFDELDRDKTSET